MKRSNWLALLFLGLLAIPFSKAQTLVAVTQIQQPTKSATFQALGVINGTYTFQSFPTTTVPTWVTEVPTGTIDGTNPTFTLSFTPLANSQLIIRNGLVVFPTTGDYLISGSTVTFQAGAIPQTGDKLVAVYQH